jgi:HK97 family phage major capsid protein
MSKTLTLADLRTKKLELGAQVRKAAADYQARRDANQEAWPDETRAAWDSINKEYDDNEQALRQAERDAEVLARSEQIRADEEQSRRTNHRPGLDDRLPGEERTYGEQGLDRDQAAVRAQREHDRRLVLRSWIVAGLAGSEPGLVTDEMRDACHRLRYTPGNDLRMPLPDSRSIRVMQRSLARMSPEDRVQAAETGELRALSTVTANAGPELVPQSFVNQMMMAILSHGDMLNAIEIITTPTGEATHWPTANDTANEGEWEAEAANVSDNQVDPVFLRQTWNAHQLHSKMIQVPLALAEDSMFDVETVVAMMLGERLGRALNRSATVGNGTGQCAGITVGAPAGVTSAAAAAISYDDVVRLEHSVDVGYRAQSSYVFHDNVLLALRLLKDTTGRPLWQQSMIEGQPDRVNNRPYVYNNHMNGTIATTNITMLYGRLTDYKLRLVRGVQTMRLNERFAEFLQVAFLSHIRADGKLQRPAADARASVKRLTQA